MRKDTRGINRRNWLKGIAVLPAFAAGGATVGDETVIVGTIAAANDVTLGRTMIQFRPASRALIPNWVNPAETITMLAYDEQ